MIKIRDAIIAHLRKHFSDIPPENIRAFQKNLDETSEGLISLPAPGIIVFIRNAPPVEDTIAPFNFRASFGACVTMKDVSAEVRDAKGWERALDVADRLDGTTFGLNQAWIRNCVIEGIDKFEGRDRTGKPTGVDYWAIPFYNVIRSSGYFGRG